MSLELIGLNRFLKIAYSKDSKRAGFIRDDVAKTINKENGFKFASGGDFYVPFWADAKDHVAGISDLRETTLARIAINKKHKGRLYPILQKSFLAWWQEKRRLRNVPIQVIDERTASRFDVPGVGVIKVENMLSLIVGDDGRRIIYPYFSEDPKLLSESARVAIWVVSQAVKKYKIDEIRILDVIHERSFSSLDTPLEGNEGDIFYEKYSSMIHEWKALKAIK